MIIVMLSSLTIAIAQFAAAQSTAPAVVDATRAGGVAPQTALAQTAKPLTAVQAYSEKQICRSIVVTGTRFAHKECHTALEWDQQSRDGSDYARYIQNRANSFCIGVC